MDALALLEKYYPLSSPARTVLFTHSRLVAEEAVEIIDNHPELGADRTFVYEAALLHDIGIFLTHAPALGCEGNFPYICHGYLGADILRQEGLPRHAWVCERHTGTGLSLEEILSQKLPLPHRDMRPHSIEEQIICYADKFYSKSSPDKRRERELVRRSLAKWGAESVNQFDLWESLFAPKIY